MKLVLNAESQRRLAQFLLDNLREDLSFSSNFDFRHKIVAETLAQDRWAFAFIKIENSKDGKYHHIEFEPEHLMTDRFPI